VVGTTCGFCLKAAAENGVVAPGDSQVSPADDSRLIDEAGRREDKLVKQGFDFTQVVTPDGPMPIELLVPPFRALPPSYARYVISLWFETAQGMFAMETERKLDSDKEPVASWRGQRGEQRLERNHVPGKYVITVRAIDGARVYGVIGIKGPVIDGRCRIDGGRLTEHPADPEHGYWWPYLLVTPAPLTTGAPRPPGAGTLLVAPNNTRFPIEDIELLRASAKCQLRDSGILAIADSLGTPVLVPLFPRPELPAEWSDLQLQALTRASLDEKLEPGFKRVDLQLIAMIDAAREKLAAEDLPVRPRVLMTGFSASGAFTNRFTVLHPEQVLAAAAGSPGWPIAPVPVDQGDHLSYPVGIDDIEKLTGQAVNLDALRRVRLLFFLGDADTNDSVGKRDSFSDADSELINRRFGTTLVARWWPAQRLYHAAEVKDVQFKLYHGVGHEVTPEMWNDILDTFRKALRAP